MGNWDTTMACRSLVAFLGKSSSSLGKHVTDCQDVYLPPNRDGDLLRNPNTNAIDVRTSSNIMLDALTPRCPVHNSLYCSNESRALVAILLVSFHPISALVMTGMIG